MDLSSCKILLWPKENNIHCLKTPLFVFFCFSVLGSLNLRKHSHPAFDFITSPNTFLETELEMWVACNWSEYSEPIKNVHFNAYADFYGEGAYFWQYRQIVQLIGLWVLKSDFQSSNPCFSLLSCVTLDKVFDLSVLPQYLHPLTRNKNRVSLGCVKNKCVC